MPNPRRVPALLFDLAGPQSGADAALFTINSINGDLEFLSMQDFENPVDANGDNDYEITVSLTNGTDTVTQDLTITITDEFTTLETCSQNVIVEDNEAPTANCQDITVQLDGSGSASIVAADVENGSTDNCGIASYSLDNTSFDCSNLGANTVTLTVTDNSGNTNTCTATVTVEDNVAPSITCIGDQSVTLDTNCEFILPDYTVLVTASDNCTASPTITQSIAAGSAISGPTAILMTATDASGNSASCTINVIPLDSSTPSITCPPDVNDGFGN